jgi:hypothetical protein
VSVRQFLSQTKYLFHSCYTAMLSSPPTVDTCHHSFCLVTSHELTKRCDPIGYWLLHGRCVCQTQRRKFFCSAMREDFVEFLILQA